MAYQNSAHEATPWLFAVSVLALAMSTFDLFWTGNGIHGSAGALLVIGSTLLMAIAAAAIAAGLARGPVRSVLAALIVLDILGTGFAAYMLEAWILLGLMFLALIAWLIGAVVGGAPSRARLSRERRHEAPCIAPPARAPGGVVHRRTELVERRAAARARVSGRIAAGGKRPAGRLEQRVGHQEGRENDPGPRANDPN